ncbi:MAG: hypothetical protein H0X25_14630 [Acidobacteriales bacterium]|nr:hypothetical protein [Terriglobales bacterium]
MHLGKSKACAPLLITSLLVILFAIAYVSGLVHTSRAPAAPASPLHETR